MSQFMFSLFLFLFFLCVMRIQPIEKKLSPNVEVIDYYTELSKIQKLKQTQNVYQIKCNNMVKMTRRETCSSIIYKAKENLFRAKIKYKIP